mgnify:CR=1 FL=1
MDRANQLALARIKAIREEAEIFKAEYPEYNDETISDYLEICTDYTATEKDYFCELLGY